MIKYLSTLILLSVIPTSANAQIYNRTETQSPAPAPKTNEVPKEVVPSKNALTNAKNVANACLDGQWETPVCLRAVSENNLILASNYAAALSENGREPAAEVIKQSCAASTAATRDTFPANVMRSAYAECVNGIVEISKGTGVIPDQSQFQLLFSAVTCLDKAQSCAAIEQGLAAYK